MCAKKTPKELPKGLYIRDGRYWGRLSIDGKQLRKPLKPNGHKYATTNLQIAKAVYKRWQQDLNQQNDRIDLVELLDEWQGAISLTGSVSQAGRNRITVDKFFEHCQIPSLDEVTKRHLQAWVAQMAADGLAPATIKNKLSSVSSFFTYCYDNDIIEKVPRIKPPKIPKLPPRFLSDSEREQVLTLAKQHNCYLEVFIPLATGIRLNELRQLEWSDFHWDQKIFVLDKTKSNRPRTIPMSQSVIDLLKPLAGDGYIFPGRNYDGCSGLREKHTFIDRLDPIRDAMPDTFKTGTAAKQAGRCYHLFRHDFGVRAAKAGVPLTDLKNWMGHVDIATTMIYAAYSPDQYSANIEKVGL